MNATDAPRSGCVDTVYTGVGVRAADKCCFQRPRNSQVIYKLSGAANEREIFNSRD
jgi:hypothetical protein